MKDKLVFNYLVDERRYELKTKSGQKVSEIVDEFIEKHDVKFPLLTDADYKDVWAHRTAINGLKNDISSARKQTCAVITNPLTDACLELEKKLQEVSDRLTEKLDEFKPREPKEKTKTIITIEYPIDSEEIAKVRTYLKKAHITYKEENK